MEQQTDAPAAALPAVPPASRPGAADFTPALANEICRRLADEQETLTEICSDPTMPHRRTIMRWAEKDPHFAAMLREAKKGVAARMADEILEIADDSSMDWHEVTRRDGSVQRVLDHEHVQRSKLRVDVRRFLMQKLDPQAYGDQLNVQGSINITRIEYVFVEPNGTLIDGNTGQVIKE